MTAPRVSIFSKDGSPVGDIRANPIYSWVLNCHPSAGECTFTVSATESWYSEKFLGIGNLVHIRHETLPTWTGVIMVRTWGSGFVTIKAMQAEYILSKRRTNSQNISGSLGGIFSQVLENTNLEPFNEKIITPSQVWVAATQQTVRAGNNALAFIQGTVAESSGDFDVQGVVDVNGKLTLIGSYYQQKGERSPLVLREKHNIEASNNIVTEDARSMANYVEGTSGANTDGARKSIVQYDENSIASFGLMQETKTFDALKSTSGLYENTLNYLASAKEPARVFDVTASNTGETFKSLNVGNVYQLDISSILFTGFNQDVRLIGMEYNAGEDTCRLVLEKYYAK